MSFLLLISFSRERRWVCSSGALVDLVSQDLFHPEVCQGFFLLWLPCQPFYIWMQMCPDFQNHFFFVLQTRNGMPLSPSTWVVLMILEVQGSLLLPCPFSFLLQGGALLNKEKCLHSPSPVLASLQRAFTWMCYLPLPQKNSCGSGYPSSPLTEENAEVQIS